MENKTAVKGGPGAGASRGAQSDCFSGLRIAALVSKLYRRLLAATGKQQGRDAQSADAPTPPNVLHAG